jgi:hypothetical protein
LLAWSSKAAPPPPEPAVSLDTQAFMIAVALIAVAAYLVRTRGDKDGIVAKVSEQRRLFQVRSTARRMSASRAPTAAEIKRRGSAECKPRHSPASRRPARPRLSAC